MSLQERLHAKLKKAYNTGFWDDLSREDAVAEHLAKASAATIAADLKGMLPKSVDHREWCDLKAPFVYSNAEDVTCSCDAPACNQTIDEMSAAVDRYCGVEGKEGE